MSYQVIARKYRPQRFGDVVGQEHVTQTLTNAIAQQRIAHAYLFCGPRGTGKTTVARIFAKCLNCTDGPKVDFPDSDPRCVEITEGRSIDVMEIDGASNNGVEQVRELRETVKYAPASSRFKIYIIDEVHMLSTAAFNALLKTLEEPPAHVKFMFATTDPEKVLPTILSRCQRFDLRRIPSALIVRHLATIAGQEGVTIDDAALYAIARGADGGMRDAESTLDQLISFCGTTIGESDVLSMFGLAAGAQLMRLAGAVVDGEAEPALRELDELARNGKDLGRFLTDLLNHFRNLLVYQVSRGDLRLLEVSEAEAVALKEQASRLGVDAMTRIMEVLVDAEGRLRDAVSKKILIEVTLLRAVQARHAVSIDSLIKRLGELRQGDEAGRPSTPAPAKAPVAPAPRAPAVAPPAPAPAAATPAAPAPVAPVAMRESVEEPVSPLPEVEVSQVPAAAGDLSALWAELVEGVGRASPFVRSYLLKAFPVSLDKRNFVIGFDPEFADYVHLVDSSRNQALIQTRLKELGRGQPAVKFIVADSPDSGPAPVSKSASEPAPASAGPEAPPVAVPVVPASASATAAESPPAPGKLEKGKPVKLDPGEFKNDPLIKAALEIFRGQIAEVRK